MYNSITIIGNLGKDPEITHFKAGDDTVCKAKFSVATSRKLKKGDETTWHNCEAIGKLAEVIQKYVKKGSKVLIDGPQLHQSYEKDGKTCYFSKIDVKTMQMLDKKEQSDNAPAKEDIPW